MPIVSSDVLKMEREEVNKREGSGERTEGGRRKESKKINRLHERKIKIDQKAHLPVKKKEEGRKKRKKDNRKKKERKKRGQKEREKERKKKERKKERKKEGKKKTGK